MSYIPSIEHGLPRILTINQGRYPLAFLASRTTHRHAITLENERFALRSALLRFSSVFSSDD